MAESAPTTEELLAAAHASCFSMQLAHGLVGAGWDPEEINVAANVSFEQERCVRSGPSQVKGLSEFHGCADVNRFYKTVA